MGFTFLEANRLVVDCTERTLTQKDSGSQVKCFPVEDACRLVHQQQKDLVIQRFAVERCLPPFPKKHFVGDAAYDFFAPKEIRLRPGERATIDTAIACHFPTGTWCLLKERSGFAHRYSIHLLGVVVDGNYRGRLKAILHNAGQEEVTIPRHTAFCQGVLLPSTLHHAVPGEVVIEGDRGATGGVNRVLSGNKKQRGLGAAAGRG